MTSDMHRDILKAALVQFQMNGLKFTMNDIAKDLHISKKTIYAFFPSKEDLLNVMLEEGFAGIQERKQAILNSDLSYADKLKTVMIALPDQFQLVDFRQLSDLKGKYPHIYNRLLEHLENDWEPVLHFLEAGIRTGIVKNVNLQILRLMITASIEAFVSTDSLKTSQISYREALEEMMEIIMNGIHEEGRK